MGIVTVGTFAVAIPGLKALGTSRFKLVFIPPLGITRKVVLPVPLSVTNAIHRATLLERSKENSVAKIELVSREDRCTVWSGH